MTSHRDGHGDRSQALINSRMTLYNLPDEVISKICSYFFAKPLCISYPFPALSCISCSDFTSLISLIHTNRKLRDLIRNNVDLWSQCLFRYPCFFNNNLKMLKHMMIKCEKKFSNLQVPSFEKCKTIESFDTFKRDNYISDDDKDFNYVIGKTKKDEDSDTDTKTCQDHHYCACESQFLDYYADFVNVFCNTQNIDIHFEGIVPLPELLYKTSPPSDFMLKKYCERFPNIQYLTFTDHRERVECNYWFHREMNFSKNLWWYNLQGILVGYYEFRALKSASFLKPNQNWLPLFKPKKESALKYLQHSISLGNGKSHILLKELQDFERDHPNIKVTSTVFGSDIQCFSVIYNYLKRVSLTIGDVTEEVCSLKNIKLLNLSWLDIIYKPNTSVSPLQIVFDNVNAPMLERFNCEQCSLTVIDTQCFPRLNSLTLHQCKFSKQFWIDSHCDSLEKLNLHFDSGVTELSDYYFNKCFKNFEELTIENGAKIIELCDIHTLKHVRVTGVDVFDANNCGKSEFDFQKVKLRTSISQQHIDKIYLCSSQECVITISATECEQLNLSYYVSSTSSSSNIHSVNIEKISTLMINMNTRNHSDIETAFSMIPSSSVVENLEWSCYNSSSKDSVSLLLECLQRFKSLRNLKLSNSNFKILHNLIEQLKTLCLPYHIENIEYSGSFWSNGSSCYFSLSIPFSNEMQSLLTHNDDSISSIMNHPYLIKNDFMRGVYDQECHIITSASLKNLNVYGSGNEPQYFTELPQIQFGDLPNLQTLKLAHLKVVERLPAMNLLTELKISKCQEVSINLSAFPSLRQCIIENCKNLSISCIDNYKSKLKFLQIKNIQELNAQLSAPEMLQPVRELVIIKIKTITSNSIINVSNMRPPFLAVLHLDEKNIVRQ
ncbi:hypothetical protein FDP41_007826 [Naegleria fowleri]|uniref:F-box domain-containing protein n=1 Tax=Naegleria fowleri TaxID=5763 RepID=A0A6A5C9P9_NAEFO|nr:uncharacterized protein FDP41_007826 [Naegleria fowleri]KAF0983911.1 hypothetical protein FDP41_007826 [Naegleria fowleri]CAG4714240.1 unnamed protein product [Naegleria fowleri]